MSARMTKKKKKLPCRTCGKLFSTDLLDAKPEPENRPDSDGRTNWTFLECEPCYGSGWLPL